MPQLIDLLGRMVFPLLENNKAIDVVHRAWARSSVDTSREDVYATAFTAALNDVLSSYRVFALDVAQSWDAAASGWVLSFDLYDLVPPTKSRPTEEADPGSQLAVAFRHFDLLSPDGERLPAEAYDLFVSSLIEHAVEAFRAVAYGESPRFRQELLAELTENEASTFEGSSSELILAASVMLQRRWLGGVKELDLLILLLDIAVNVSTDESAIVEVASVALSSPFHERRLLDLAKEMLARALAQTPSDDFEARLRIAQLLLIGDDASFVEGRQLVEQLLEQDPSRLPQIVDALLLMVRGQLDRRVGFKMVAHQLERLIDFILAIDPDSIEQIVQLLVDIYSQFGDLAHLQQARNILLRRLKDTGANNIHKYTDSLFSILVIYPYAELLRYAKLIFEEGYVPERAIEVAECMVRHRIRNYEDLFWFLDRALEENPQSRQRVVRAYLQLFNLLREYNLESDIHPLLKRIIGLTDDLSELIVQSGNELYQQLLTLVDLVPVLESSGRYSKADALETARDLYLAAGAAARLTALIELTKREQTLNAAGVPELALDLLTADKDAIPGLLDEIRVRWRRMEDANFAYVSSASLDLLKVLIKLLMKADPLTLEFKVSDSKARIVPVLIGLGIRASAHGRQDLYEEALRRAMELAGGLRELAELQIEDRLEPADRLTTLLDLQRIIRRTAWYNEDDFTAVGIEIIRMAKGEKWHRRINQVISQAGDITYLQQRAWLRELSSSLYDLEAFEFPRPQARVEAHRVPWGTAVTTRIALFWVLIVDLVADIARALRAKTRRLVKRLLRMIRRLLSRRFSKDLVLYEEGDEGDELSLDIDYMPQAAYASEEDEDYLMVPRDYGTTDKHTPMQPRRVERHTEIDFPDVCATGRPAQLRIKLRRERPIRSRAFEKVEVEVGPDIKEITIHVNVSAPAFAIQQPHKSLVLPVEEDSDELSFTLVPLEEGQQSIEIEFIHGATRVGYAVVKTEIRQEAEQQSLSNVAILEDHAEELRKLTRKPKNPDPHMIHVYWQPREGKLSYTIFSADNLNDVGGGEQTNSAAEAAAAAYLHDLDSFLTEAANQRNPQEEDWKSLMFNLCSMGDDLRTKLVPDQVSASVANWPSGSVVRISTNEQWIPWELLHDDHGFWGDRFILARLPRYPEGAPVVRSIKTEMVPPAMPRKVVNVVGGGLDKAYIPQIVALFDSFKLMDVVLLQGRSVSEMDKALQGADILHMTCHGDAEHHYLQVDDRKGRVTNLIPEAVRRLSLEPGSMVFANACSSAAPTLSLGQFRSFGWEFYLRHTVFVGTLGSVPVGYANDFAQVVYRELLRQNQPLSIGQAIAVARQEAVKQRNIFWLFYCIYGDPDFTVARA